MIVKRKKFFFLIWGGRVVGQNKILNDVGGGGRPGTIWYHTVVSTSRPLDWHWLSPYMKIKIVCSECPKKDSL